METAKTYTVYMHIAPNGKKYIGITKNKPARRWEKGNKYKGCTHFYNAIKKYGWDNIKHIILLEGLTKEEAEQKEKELIKQHKSNNREYGYNIESGGALGKEVSEETREKLRKNATGVKPSKETREKMSRAHKGKKCHFYGIPVTEEFKQRLREVHSKPVAQYDQENRLIKTFSSAKEAAKSVNRTRQAITACCRGNSKTCAGYIWEWC